MKALPNLICLGRIVLVAPILWALTSGRYELTLWLFALAGFSDGLDGFLAKRFGWRTRLGSLLDPLADKFLLVCVFLAVTVLGLVPVWLTVIVIGRDVIIIAGALAYARVAGPLRGEPTAASKVNTAAQILFILAVIAGAAYAWPPEGIVTALGALVFVTTVVSGADYVWTWGRRALGASRAA